MAVYGYEHFSMREERMFFLSWAPPPFESYTNIGDCHGILYTTPNMAAPLDEYGSCPKKTVTTTTASAIRPSLPPPRQVKYYQPTNTASHQVPNDQIKRPVFNDVEGPAQMENRVITSTEAAKLYGGYLVTEYGARKPSVITSTEAAKRYGGYLVTEYGAWKPSGPY